MHRPWVQPLANKSFKFLVRKKSETLRSLKNKNNKEHVYNTHNYINFPQNNFSRVIFLLSN